MPKPSLVKDVLKDLGKPTRRGFRKCYKCGTITGTRAKSCKNPSCDVVFRENLYCKKSPSDDGARRITLDSQHCQVFSVRQYARGADYRTFVQLPVHQPNISTTTSSKSISFGARCFSDACSGNKSFPCSHIKAAEECNSDTQRILIKESVLSTIGIPSEPKQILAGLVYQTPDSVVQRCSSQTFVVNCGLNGALQPFGCCHMLFFKRIKDDGTRNEQKFFCSCQPMKSNNHPNGQEKLFPETPNKYCLHYYACVYAFASNEELSIEFQSFLTRAYEVYPATILSQLHFTLVNHGHQNGESVPPVHPDQISQQTMRDNLSLLESIAGVDDTSSEMHSVKSPQCSLSEHATITSTEDAISFGDSSTIDSLEDNDLNCTPHLSHISEILTPSPQNIHADSPMYHSEEVKPEEVLGLDSGSSQIPEYLACITQQHSPVDTVLAHEDRNQRPEAPIQEVPASISLEAFSRGWEKRVALMASFEKWLAGIIERINAAMNYQLPETCSIVEFVPQEIFDCLKKRIIPRCRKNQSQIVTIKRIYTAPVGIFEKYTWNILSIIHLLNIFRSSQVPLKLSQFFCLTPAGMYEEWLPSKDKDKNHIPVMPVLHCSKFKVGKLDRTGKDLTPFVIEWIPDILPASAVGELTITFQVTHVGPIHTEEERKACNVPIQRLITQSQSFSIAPT